MHTQDTSLWKHNHIFGQDTVKPGERRTLLVVLITLVAMVVEVTAGLIFGSMALLADGLHMGSHAVALGIAFLAYVVARRYAHDERFSFGTGKINALAGFTGALLLAIFALGVGWESVTRLVQPVEIAYTQAIIVAIAGLVVNVVCAVILLGGGHGHAHDHTHDHSHDHGHGHTHAHHGDADHGHDAKPGHEDLNLRAAYLHVLADAITSLLAIFALLGGQIFGAAWLDATMGIVGALLIARWSVSLATSSAAVLLDYQAPASVRDRIKTALEEGDDRIVDLHVWSIGPGIRAAVVSLVTDDPKQPQDYKDRLPDDLGVVHFTVETHRCMHHESLAA